jgi:hypothetical protein
VRTQDPFRGTELTMCRYAAFLVVFIGSNH